MKAYENRNPNECEWSKDCLGTPVCYLAVLPCALVGRCPDGRDEKPQPPKGE